MLYLLKYNNSNIIVKYKIIIIILKLNNNNFSYDTIQL